MRGETLKELKFLLCLGVLGVLSLACSGPGDSSGEDAKDVFGIRIPDEILSTFKSISGGNIQNIGVQNDTTEVTTYGLYSSDDAKGVIYVQNYYNDDWAYFVSGNGALRPNLDGPPIGSDVLPGAKGEAGDGAGQSQKVDSFAIMDTEVTIQMYTDFLNRLAQRESLTSTSTTGIAFSSVDSLYRGNMASSLYCGIYANDSSGKIIDVPIQTYAGYSTVFSKSNNAYTDPNFEYQKPMMASSLGISKFSYDPDRKNYPMVFISQSEAKEFCKWLGTNYRLPTWQEWEYAANGGRTGVNFATSTGNIINTTTGKYLANIQGFYSDAAGTTPVKSYPANPYGLYDMTGNVFEMTYFTAEDEATGSTIPFAPYKFRMGGSYSTRSFAISSNWSRYGQQEDGAWSAGLGFRVVYDRTRALTFGARYLP